jgi:phosphopantetheine adenylyltransferase
MLPDFSGDSKIVSKAKNQLDNVSVLVLTKKDKDEEMKQ